MLGAVLCFGAAHATGHPLEVDGRGTAQPVPLPAVVLATLVGAAAGWVLARLSTRTSRPRRTFLALAGAGLLITAVPPVQAATTAATTAWLLAMHAMVAAALIPSSPPPCRSARRPGRSEGAGPPPGGRDPVERHRRARRPGPSRLRARRPPPLRADPPVAE